MSVPHQLAVGSNRQAIVIGGSMAGLLAARVLAERFNQVTIIERDRIPDKPETRRGVLQAHQAHVLLLRGQQILEQLFPGLGTELAAAGATALDWTLDCPMLDFGGWAPRFSSGLVTRACSRNLLEWMIRRRLAAYSNVRFLEECQATELLSDTSKTKVTGVQVQFHNHGQNTSAADVETQNSASLPADLVVDATGRNSKTPEWIKALGYTPPQETVINSFLGYASRWYQRPADFQSDWKSIVVWSKPGENSRGGLLYPCEGDAFVITLAGLGRDYPPSDEAGYLEFARSLRSPILYEVVKQAQPISPIYCHRGTENRLRHYEQSRLPENFVVLGDAVCSFNPIYGQGMTAAAMAALTLEECLKEQFQRHSQDDLTGLTRRFQKQLAKVNHIPWLMATGEDFRWPTTEGGQPDLRTRFMQRYLDRVRLITVESPVAFKVFIEVLHLLKPPTALFQPSILMQVLRQVITRRHQDQPNANELSLPKLPSSAVDSLT
ncbi:FAD-dependent monooxygenase [Coleofasciculus sp. FACHB-T130]|uniref:FAD-dependent oxidoreductase n=1 Tax=Cyanophyceae TaxID=3028117 RepID=UPI00168750D2|nr:FAD-dependent monooxygenase [Coleofasciculus sp. FACHB-T130]MBD1879443.1 FAD-dependent monooxygenase [Coleofasciculus sp. FACHB-T130]